MHSNRIACWRLLWLFFRRGRGMLSWRAVEFCGAIIAGDFCNWICEILYITWEGFRVQRVQWLVPWIGGTLFFSSSEIAVTSLNHAVMGKVNFLRSFTVPFGFYCPICFSHTSTSTSTNSEHSSVSECLCVHVLWPTRNTGPSVKFGDMISIIVNRVIKLN